MTIINPLLFLFVLGTTLARADTKLPDSMPAQAAQDLDYAQMKRARIVNEALEEFKKMLTKLTYKQDKTIAEIVEKYKLHLFDERGQMLDSVDSETGKIHRAVAKK